ncbi:FSR family fosmidomycin resistance protein-like MFS transporter [Chitinophaga dinghuensis]|uniref:FSR family fosmidomycin resistance protein-like MFS transporter n=1 Tax=Chitinophaga dinghuensis TaxID=1539050 RepID=A0A327W9C5_9BACT|nr:MFS transporter [Chitinophaga dinghuensis]RAJ85842.1 FSR family fosmidomycin resistance protein-like MFS transporter [Chitinophaga dinghuensis]
MSTTLAEQKEPQIAEKVAQQTVFSILIALSFTHLLNDTLQSLIPAIYPLVRESLKLSYSQVGLITLTFQMSASILQPLVGLYTDKKPQPYSLAIGMSFTLLGLVSLSFAHTFAMVLVSVALTGVGSAVFHPEASRLAHMAAGGKHGMAQSLFQVGGNAGSSLGPLLAAAIIVPFGQGNVIWFSLAALLAIVVMLRISKWYKGNMHRAKPKKVAKQLEQPHLPKATVVFSLTILLVLIFSKYFYMASMTSYYTFYLINKFHVSVQSAQVYLFIFLFSVAAGTFIGGPVGDKIGRKYVIWISILGVAPFSLLLPHANLAWTAILSVFIGVILSSAFSAILVYAQELVPGNVGMIAGLFFGLAFGMGGVGSALLGKLADNTSIDYVYQVCAYLPLIGLLTGLLPNLEKRKS